jgi:hypothetical protein
MRISNHMPPSRQGKKQVIAFLRPNQIKAVYDKAAAEDKTNQEIIGEALNAVFEEHGMPPLIKPGHHRIVRRNRGKSRVREEGTGPGCRAGRQSLGGWFDEDIVVKLNRFSSETNQSVQTIVERGVALITGIETDEGPDWMSVLDDQEKAKTDGVAA